MAEEWGTSSGDREQGHWRVLSCGLVQRFRAKRPVGRNQKSHEGGMDGVTFLLAYCPLSSKISLPPPVYGIYKSHLPLLTLHLTGCSTPNLWILSKLTFIKCLPRVRVITCSPILFWKHCLNFWDIVLSRVSWQLPSSYFPVSLTDSASVHTVRDTQSRWQPSHIMQESQVGAWLV